MVHREDRAERRGGGEHLGQPGELLVAQLAVVVTGHRRVEGDEPQPVELVDAVDGTHRIGECLVQQLGAERRAIVVVAHHPEHAGAEARGERLDERAQVGVGIALAEVDEVAGEDDRRRARRRTPRSTSSARVSRAVASTRSNRRDAGRAQVGVAEVQQDALGRRVLGVAHVGSLPSAARRAARATGPQRAKCYRHVS